MYQQVAEPFVIDVARGTKGRALAGMLVAGGFGLVAVISAATGGVSGGRAAEVAAMVLGAVLLVIAAVGLLGWRVLTRPRQLILDRNGIRWHDPQGAPWAVGWAELSAITVSRTVNRAPGRFRSTMVRLDLFPADPEFRNRHPEMDHLWEFHKVRDGYRLPFGSAGELVAPLDVALRHCAGPRYVGVRDEGFTIGLF
ncbi:phage holin family protein [Nocardia otitidiscaviarum]|uniref:phage holin family protein n=1 Tax=Nocardia otitidiscaviarum TaxID=1823 RepID=UPI0011DC834A|nr:phage holin family protein [Nocardia otitidiscaviarum]